MGCLTVSALAAIGAGAFIGVAFRDRWRVGKPLTAITAASSAGGFAAELASYQSRGYVPEGQPATEATQPLLAGWSRWTHRLQINADECVALVASAHEGYASPRFSGLFADDPMAAQTFDLAAAQGNNLPFSNDPRWLYTVTSEGLATSVAWCAHQPKSVEARVLFRTVDGFTPPRRADATVRWQVLRGPWTATGGVQSLYTASAHNTALAALAAEFSDPLASANEAPSPGLSAQGTPKDLLVGTAALFPANTTAATELYQLAARDSGIAVHPRVELTLSEQERSTVNATFTALAAGRALPTEHDPIVDVGRNDFYRVLAVVDATQIPATCVTFVLARGQGLFAPTISRYVRGTRQRTPLATTRSNIAIDRVCPTDGVFSYIVDDIDQQTYRITQWAAGNEAAPTRRGRGR